MAGFRDIFDDSFLQYLFFGPEVVGNHAVAEHFEKFFLEKHFVELLEGVAEQLNCYEHTILSNYP